MRGEDRDALARAGYRGMQNERRRRDAARVLRAGPRADAALRRAASRLARRAPARRSEVHLPRRARARERRAPATTYRDQRPRARVAAVVLPLEQHPGRGAAHARRAGQAARAGGARGAGEAHARRSALRGAHRRTSRASGSICARSRATCRSRRSFPDFDDNLRQAFRRETELFFDSLIREDRAVTDLLTADYTFVERAAREALRHPGRLRQPSSNA